MAFDKKTITGGADLTHPRLNPNWIIKAFVALMVVICLILLALWAVKNYIQPAAQNVAGRVPVLNQAVGASAATGGNGISGLQVI